MDIVKRVFYFITALALVLFVRSWWDALNNVVKIEMNTRGKR
jgi:hypothetical protein